MEKIARLISVVAIAMALMIAFSGVASANWLTEYTPEKPITTIMSCNQNSISPNYP